MQTKKSFFNSLNSTLQCITSKRELCYILGDLNINTYSSTLKNDGHEFLNALNSNAFQSLITEPTRVTQISKTTIDHILTNENHYNVYNAVLQYKISDHHITLCTISKCPTPNPNVFVQKRFDLKKFNQAEFCVNLQISLESDFQKICDNDDINEPVNKFCAIVK